MHLQKPMLGTPLDWSNPLNKGLVMHLAMNEGMGDVVRDLSLYGNHGTLNNFAHPPTAASGWNPGQTGVGLNFDGSDDYVNCGHNASLDITGTITIEALIKRTGNGYILAKRDGDEKQYALYCTAENSLRFYTWGADDSMASDNNIVPSDEWAHIVVVAMSPGFGELYCNGIPVATDNTFTPITTAVSDVFVGGRGDGAGGIFTPILGSVDYVRVLNQPYTAKEVLELSINPYQVYLDEDDHT